MRQNEDSEKNSSPRWDLNRRPSVIWSDALTTELLETLWRARVNLWVLTGTASPLSRCWLAASRYALMRQCAAVSEFSHVLVITWLCSRAMRFEARPINWPLLAMESPVHVARWLDHGGLCVQSPSWTRFFFPSLHFASQLIVVCCFIFDKALTN